MSFANVKLRREILDELLIGAYLMSGPRTPLEEMPWMGKHYPPPPSNDKVRDPVLRLRSQHELPRLPWDLDTHSKSTHASYDEVPSNKYDVIIPGSSPVCKSPTFIPYPEYSDFSPRYIPSAIEGSVRVQRQYGGRRGCRQTDSVSTQSFTATKSKSADVVLTPNNRKLKGRMVVMEPDCVLQRKRKAVAGGILRDYQLDTTLVIKDTLFQDSEYDTSGADHTTTAGKNEVSKVKGKQMRKIEFAKVDPIWNGERSTVYTTNELKRIAKLFCVESLIHAKIRKKKENASGKKTTKITPVWDGKPDRKRTKHELAVIAAMFCVETEEQAFLRRLRAHVVDFGLDNKGGNSLGSCSKIGHLSDIDIIKEEKENTVEMVKEIGLENVLGEECKENGENMAVKEKKSRNPIMRFIRYVRRKFMNK